MALTFERTPSRTGLARGLPIRREVRPLNIVHYMPNFRFADGGVVRAVHDWCRVRSRRGHRVSLMTYDGPDIPADWLEGASDEPHAVMLPKPVMRGTRLGRGAIAQAEMKIKPA